MAFLNGVEDVQSGLRTIWSGKIANSIEYDVAMAMGASENTATAIDIGVGMIGGGLDDFGRALTGQRQVVVWSAATCRRFGFDSTRRVSVSGW